ncbi:MAG TPA: CHAP domain-containing protein [Ktedonobacterales bacterium]
MAQRGTGRDSGTAGARRGTPRAAARKAQTGMPRTLPALPDEATNTSPQATAPTSTPRQRRARADASGGEQRQPGTSSGRRRAPANAERWSAFEPGASGSVFLPTARHGASTPPAANDHPFSTAPNLESPDPAAPDLAAPDLSSPTTSSPRQTSRHQARRIRPEDTVTVARATMAIQAIEVIQSDATAAGANLPAVWERSTENLPVTLVAGNGSGKGVAIRVGAPKRKRRSLLAGMVACVLCASVLATIAYAIHPMGGKPESTKPLALVAARLSQPARPTTGTPDASQPSVGDLNASAWASSSGGQELGLGGGAGPGVTAPGSAGLPVTTPPKPSGSGAAGVGISPAPLSPWPPSNAFMYVPGHPAFAVSGPPNNFYYWAFGQCTWWAQWERRDENLTRMGNARYWAGSAAGRGYTISSRPKAGATVVFQPGVQGAGGAGHVAHVVAVYPAGWFLVSEMNFYWNGGGFARVDYRYAHSGWGVQFIY